MLGKKRPHNLIGLCLSAATTDSPHSPCLPCAGQYYEDIVEQLAHIALAAAAHPTSRHPSLPTSPAPASLPATDAADTSAHARPPRGTLSQPMGAAGRPTGPYIIGIAGSPGSGKSTLAALVCKRCNELAAAAAAAGGGETAEVAVVVPMVSGLHLGTSPASRFFPFFQSSVSTTHLLLRFVDACIPC